MKSPITSAWPRRTSSDGPARSDRSGRCSSRPGTQTARGSTPRPASSSLENLLDDIGVLRTAQSPFATLVAETAALSLGSCHRIEHRRARLHSRIGVLCIHLLVQEDLGHGQLRLGVVARTIRLEELLPLDLIILQLAPDEILLELKIRMPSRNSFISAANSG